MFDIQGKYNTAVCFAKAIDEKAEEQIRSLCDYDFLSDCKIRIMPDVHAGKGCTIGTTMTIHDRIIPNLVGVDIGCGMYTVDLGKQDIDCEKLDTAAHAVPSAMNVWDAAIEEFDLSDLRCLTHLHKLNWLRASLGTLGGGNHFIEVDRSSDGTKYLVIHSGSRNLGHQAASYYQQLAIDLNKGKETYPEERNRIIEEYKASGREKEIQGALKKIAWSNRKTSIPEEVCYLYGQYMEDYLHDVSICQQFACRNRELIAGILLEKAGLQGGQAFHTIHNYMDLDEMILRKGAIAAPAGKTVLIPINMRDGSILAVGKGNPDWNYSAPHGAGRLMSRSTAFRQLSMDEYRQQMEGIYTTSVNANTLDEAPMAYKSLDDILDVIQDTVDVVDILKPVYNFKAG